MPSFSKETPKQNSIKVYRMKENIHQLSEECVCVCVWKSTSHKIFVSFKGGVCVCVDRIKENIYQLSEMCMCMWKYTSHISQSCR